MFEQEKKKTHNKIHFYLEIEQALSHESQCCFSALLSKCTSARMHKLKPSSHCDANRNLPALSNTVQYRISSLPDRPIRWLDDDRWKGSLEPLRCLGKRQFSVVEDSWPSTLMSWQATIPHTRSERESTRKKFNNHQNISSLTNWGHVFRARKCEQS